jgi:hypothetical protein
MDKADAAHLCRLLRLSVICSLAALSGCLPESDSGNSASKQAVLAFSGSGEGSANHSNKGDPLLGNVAPTPANVLERSIGSSEPSSRGDREPLNAGSAASLTDAGASVPIEDTPPAVALGGFFKALRGLESKSSQGAITILHLGDSHIAADRFSGDMRDQFQSQFGNAGRGMMMPGLYLARGVKFDQGGKWQAALSTGTVPGPYGLTGVKLSAATREDWLRLTTTDHPFTWAEITVETGPDQGSALVALDGEMKLVPANMPSPSWKTIRLEKPAREIVIRPKGDGPLTVHAVAIGEQKPGVRYINLGLPGATAMTPLSWHTGQLAHDMQRVSPDLIIVSYGTEESFDDNLNIKEYESKVMRMLGMLRQAAPRASLLVIGPPDVARLPNFGAGAGRTTSDVCRALSPQERANYPQRLRSGDQRLARWHPPLMLGEVRRALRRAAASSQAYFWDWSKLMGGTCGVHAWVHSDPPLAANDHIHLTEEGSKRSARLLFRELMTGYDAYDRPVAAVAIPQPQPAQQPQPVAATRPAAARKPAKAAP